MANQKEIGEHYDLLAPLHAIRLQQDECGFPDYT